MDGEDFSGIRPAGDRQLGSWVYVIWALVAVGVVATVLLALYALFLQALPALTS